ncbi:MAG: DUF4116 domain-containing protein [Candidatus Saganbacteria bacterium]|nr:DUF4116 domain-containing protein [Candidatus Saganbacteria bacterium]
MEKVTLTGTVNIESVYARLRKIDSIKDGKIDGNITREELDLAAKKQVDTSVQFNESKTTSFEVIQKLYLKLQTMDKEDGKLDGNIKDLRFRLNFPLTPEQQRKFSLQLELEASDLTGKKEEAPKKDKEAVPAAVKKDERAAKPSADTASKKDRASVLAAVKQYGNGLQYAGELFKKDREIVLAAVKENGLALVYADESLKKDKNIVLAAVKQNGWALYFADDSLKKDKEVVLAAVKQHEWALNYADASLQKDPDILKAAGK